MDKRPVGRPKIYPGESKLRYMMVSKEALEMLKSLKKTENERSYYKAIEKYFRRNKGWK